jgi:hypothetical protein
VVIAVPPAGRAIRAEALSSRPFAAKLSRFSGFWQCDAKFAHPARLPIWPRKSPLFGVAFGFPAAVRIAIAAAAAVFRYEFSIV